MKIRKVVTARFVAEVDSDEWAAEYGLDPADLDSVQSDVGDWLHNATDVSLTEMPGNANTLRITSVEQEIEKSEVVA